MGAPTQWFSDRDRHARLCAPCRKGVSPAPPTGSNPCPRPLEIVGQIGCGIEGANPSTSPRPAPKLSSVTSTRSHRTARACRTEALTHGRPGCRRDRQLHRSAVVDRKFADIRAAHSDPCRSFDRFADFLPLVAIGLAEVEACPRPIRPPYGVIGHRNRSAGRAGFEVRQVTGTRARTISPAAPRRTRSARRYCPATSYWPRSNSAASAPTASIAAHATRPGSRSPSAARPRLSIRTPSATADALHETPSPPPVSLVPRATLVHLLREARSPMTVAGRRGVHAR